MKSYISRLIQQLTHIVDSFDPAKFDCTYQTDPLRGQCMISKILSSPFLVKLLEQNIRTYFFIGISNFIFHMSRERNNTFMSFLRSLIDFQVGFCNQTQNLNCSIAALDFLVLWSLALQYVHVEPICNCKEKFTIRNNDFGSICILCT